MHEIYQSWRAIADEAPGRMLIGEVWLPDAARLARYVGPGELHTVFNFPYLNCPWDAAELRQVIDATLALTRRSAPPPPGCCPTTTSTGSSPGTAVPTPRST